MQREGGAKQTCPAPGSMVACGGRDSYYAFKNHILITALDLGFLHLHFTLGMIKCAVYTVFSRWGAILSQPHTGIQGNLLFGKAHCRTALRCLKMLMVILSFPKSAHQERSSVGTCERCVLPDGGRCACRGASQPVS